MERGENDLGGTYEGDAMGVPDHTGEPERDPIPVDEQMPPAERPRAADDWGTTAAEQRASRPLSDRLDAERPERPQGANDEGLRLVDDGDPDRTAELTSTGFRTDDEDETAEEAAMHVRPDAPGGTSGPDAYVADADGEPEGSA